MKLINFYLLGFSMLSIMFTSCGDDDVTSVGDQTFDSGVLIINEGPFSGGSATIDFLDRDSDEITTDVYSTVNDGQVIGSILQSVTIIGDDAYLIVNNSAKIEVVDAATLEYKNTITGVFSPRYIADLGNGTAVVSEWGSDGVSGQLKLVDLASNIVTDSLAVVGPEQMVVSNNSIYVANSGGFGESNMVTVHGFDLVQQTSIALGKRTIDMTQDTNGDIWVLSGGSFADLDGDGFADADGSSICKISNNVSTFCKDLSGFASDLIKDESGSNLYYVESGEIKKLEINNAEEDFTVTVDGLSGVIYGLGYDGIDNALLVTTTPDFSSNSTIYVVFDDGAATKAFTTGVLTNGFIAR